MTQQEADRFWIKEALALAEAGRGYVSPNPLVGCVILDKNGKKIGEGYHERVGKNHAEINALQSVTDKSALDGATVYVTLEPCSHHGKTPPCAEELIKWPLKRVVVALQDPNPQVNGAGIKLLKSNGIEVTTGVEAGAAAAQNRFFLHHISTGRPFVTLKIAQTLDGYIALPGGANEPVTGKQAQTLVHSWRATYDAVLVGQNTALADDPQLTVRLVEGRQPWRVVIDGDASLPETLHLFTDAYDEKTIRVTNRPEAAGKTDPLLALLAGASKSYEWMLAARKNGHTDLGDVFDKLGARGIASVLVEGGQRLSTALLEQQLVDEIQVFVAPKLLGGGIKSVLGLKPERMDRALPLKNVTVTPVGADWLFTATPG